MPAKLITAIRVEKLFGLYSYSLPENGLMSNAAILYGDNGVGKSTLLRLVFHLLSAANDKGHRTALSDADFENLEVDLSSGVTLSARPTVDNDLKILHLEIKNEDGVLAIWDHFPAVDQRRFFEDGDAIIEVIEGGKSFVRRQIKSQLKKGKKYLVETKRIFPF